MLRFLLFFIVAVMPVAGFSQKKSTVPNETISIKTVIKCDHCLRCATCAPHIVDGLWSVKGFVRAVVHPEEHRIEVTYKPNKTNPEALRKAISEAGFDADDIKANPKSVRGLDKCCRPNVDDEE